MTLAFLLSLIALTVWSLRYVKEDQPRDRIGRFTKVKKDVVYYSDLHR